MKYVYYKYSLSLLVSLILISNIIYAQWNSQYNQSNDILHSIYFADYNNGWAVGGRLFVGALILKSTDGGSSWSDNLTIPGTVNWFNSVFFTDDNTGWVVGGGGVMMQTTNAGTTWDTVAIATDGYLHQIQFINSNYGWVAGTEDNLTRGIILRTTDGGSNWERIDIGSESLFVTINFLNQNLGWGSGSGIQKTTDGGYNWVTKKDTGGLSIFFADELNGWSVGSSISGPFGYIHQTTDEGNTWSSISGSDIPALKSVNFFDKNIGWAVGNHSSSSIIKTTDGGNNWFHQESGTINSLRSVCIIDSVTGWAAGSGSILKTTNGGVTFINDEIEDIPTNFILNQNYPNPFNPSTSIRYTISDMQFVSIIVYDILGNEVATLVNSEKPSGVYVVEWNASNIPSGVYFYQLKTGLFVQTKKMILMK